MTLREVCELIEFETRTRTWDAADHEMRCDVIEGCIHQLTGALPGEQASKKIKQRKPRKAKTVPLTQHAGLGAGLEGNE